jgi:hypothetical protein
MMQIFHKIKMQIACTIHLIFFTQVCSVNTRIELNFFYTHKNSVGNFRLIGKSREGSVRRLLHGRYLVPSSSAVNSRTRWRLVLCLVILEEILIMQIRNISPINFVSIVSHDCKQRGIFVVEPLSLQ